MFSTKKIMDSFRISCFIWNSMRRLTKAWACLARFSDKGMGIYFCLCSLVCSLSVKLYHEIIITFAEALVQNIVANVWIEVAIRHTHVGRKGLTTHSYHDICVYLYLSIYLSNYLSIHLSIYLSVNIYISKKLWKVQKKTRPLAKLYTTSYVKKDQTGNVQGQRQQWRRLCREERHE